MLPSCGRRVRARSRELYGTYNQVQPSHRVTQVAGARTTLNTLGAVTPDSPRGAPPRTLSVVLLGGRRAPLHPLEAAVLEMVAEDAREEATVADDGDDALRACGDPGFEHLDALEQVVPVKGGCAWPCRCACTPSHGHVLCSVFVFVLMLALISARLMPCIHVHAHASTDMDMGDGHGGGRTR